MSFDLFLSHLSSLDSSELSTLLRHRADVMVPVPKDLSVIVTRLTQTRSLELALTQMNADALHTIESALAQGAEHHSIDLEVAPHTWQQLLEWGLAFPTDDGWMVVDGVSSALPRSWHIEQWFGVREYQEKLDTLDSATRGILENLARQGGVGHTRDAAVDADPTRPIPRLISLGILERVDETYVRLPAPAMRLLTGVGAREVPRREPDVDKQVPESTDGAGVAALLEAVRRVDELLEYVGATPVKLNRDSSIGVRAAQALRRDLGQDVAVYLALAHACQLIDLGHARNVPEGYDEFADVIAPTALRTHWQEADLAGRATMLIAGWAHSTHQHWAEGKLLDPELQLNALPMYRRQLLQVYALGGQLHDPDAMFAYHRPLLSAQINDETFEGLRSEAHVLGLLVNDCLPTYTRLVAAGNSEADIEEVLCEAIPAPVDHLIIQADMTILAPGPLASDDASMLATFADCETPGLASVYRLSEASLRHGFDTGITSAQFMQWLENLAVGEIPQTVRYLISDVAARHGGIRGGAISSYLRSDDTAVLDMLMANPLEDAHMQRLAPQVIVSSARLKDLIDHAASHGIHIVAEDDGGNVVNLRPDPAQVAGTHTAPSLYGPQVLFDDHAARLLSTNPSPTHEEHKPISETISSAIRASRQLKISVARPGHTPTSMTMRPLSLDGGALLAVTPQGNAMNIPLSRIAAIEEIP